jgi:L-ascorbate metabolism protein UlaG (beta-lactamase superfamily)
MAFAPLPASAQQCVGLANAPARSLVQPAGLKLAQKARGSVKITFIGHATFLIESPEGIRIVTDYNDYVRPQIVPDIITMNIAHDSHFTMAPDARIRHVLPGWNPRGGPAEHDLKVGDVHVRNISTNIRDFGGGTREFGNSVFVFEIAGLCIAHLGHLHHTLTVQQLGQIGQMDVLLVPVDGGYTLDLDGMADVLKSLNARMMIPMHMFSSYGLERFLRRVRQDFEVVENPVPSVTLSRATLPEKPQVLVLPGR